MAYPWAHLPEHLRGALQWLDEYMEPLTEWMDDIELTNAELLPDAMASFSKVRAPPPPQWPCSR